LFGISLPHLARFLFALFGYPAACNYFIASHLRPNGFVSGGEYLVTCILGICKSPVGAFRVRMRARLVNN